MKSEFAAPYQYDLTNKDQCRTCSAIPYVDYEVVGPHKDSQCYFQGAFDKYCTHCGRFGHTDCGIFF